MSDSTRVRRTDSAGNPTLSIGPMDVDSAAEVTARLGTHNKATTLLKRHGQMFPPALRQLLSRPVDGERTDFLRNSPDLLEAVKDAALAVSGRRRFLEEDDTLESAAVQGDDLSGRVISLLYRTADSGRSARGVIDYGAVPAIERQFQAQIAQPAQTHSGGGDGDALGAGAGDPERAAELERIAEEAEAERQALAQEVEELREAAAAAANPEPFPGYDDLTADQVIQRVREGGYKEFGTAGLERIDEYESSQDRPRKTVVEAVKAALDEVPPDASSE